MAYPDFSEPFHLYTDASTVGLGYRHGQVFDSKQVVNAHSGRQLNCSEQNYNTTEQEALEGVDGIRKYHVYVYGKNSVHTLLLCHIWHSGKRRTGRLFSQQVVPVNLRHEIFTNAQDETTCGHMGIPKIYEKLRRKYYWVGMFKEVGIWWKSCVDCVMKKSPRYRRRTPLLPIPVEGAFDRVTVDILGSFPTTNSATRYIVVFFDYYTRLTETFALRSCEAHRLASLFVNEIIVRHGSPRCILFDCGRNFLAGIVKETCRLMNTSNLNTTTYYPHIDGLVVRFSGTLIGRNTLHVCQHQQERLG